MSKVHLLAIYLLIALYVCCNIYLLTFILTPPEVELEAWPLHASRNIQHYLDFRKPPLIKPTNACTSAFWFLIVVHSHLNNFAERSLIRNTWGSRDFVEAQGIKIVFLCGLTEVDTTQQNNFVDEVTRFNDIIQEAFIDTYQNLTLKSVLMLRLAGQCRHVKYLMKADDDVYVNIPRVLTLINYIKANNVEGDLLLGEVLDHSPRFKFATDKFYSPAYMFDGDVYPPYLRGLGYIMTTSATRKLFKAALEVKIFHLEDVFVTGMCAAHAGIVQSNIVKFAHEDFPEDLCDFLTLCVTTGIRMEVLQYVHNITENFRIPCALASRTESVICCI